MKKLLIMFLFSTLLMADSASDRTTRPLDNSAEELVKESFRGLVSAYTDKDIAAFMDNVSEDNFQQDYITFDDAIRQDFRVYNVFNLDYWFNQMIPDGDKLMYVNVRWSKEYESLKSSKLLRKNAQSWFLFVKEDGRYKLIGMAGRAMWGESRNEWLQESPISTKKLRR